MQQYTAQRLFPEAAGHGEPWLALNLSTVETNDHMHNGEYLSIVTPITPVPHETEHATVSSTRVAPFYKSTCIQSRATGAFGWNKSCPLNSVDVKLD
jgi:hypothetical protein